MFFILKKHTLPKNLISGSCVKPFDYDNDGDLDLFIGGRQIPGKYPNPASSLILENKSSKNNISFVDVTNTIAPNLTSIGMVTDAKWVNVNDDDLTDLVIVGEWMPLTILINNGNSFIDSSQEMGLSKHIGWWNSIEAGDFDNDGDMDLIGGNLGLNYKYKASYDEPFEVYAKDFDKSGNLDIVLGYYNQGDLFPLRGRECSSNQMPFIKNKFSNYDAFGKATLAEVYGEENLNEAIHYRATTFATTLFENNKGQKF